MAHRRLILERVRARQTLADIYRAVDALAAQQGLQNRHRAYPFSVLAHRLTPPTPGTFGAMALGFGTRSVRAIAASLIDGLRAGWSPLWSDARRSEHPPVPGFWAVEPHLARLGVGAKFEEILVVTQDDAYWLSDDVPHVRRQLARSAA
jgi:hypothetical protein